ncbi:PepSY domain-containing protein, partial [Roseomonas sp. KE0001]
MKTGFRQSMAWLHTWSGLLVGWVLFLIFLTGTASYFRPEISFWARPELHRPQAEVASLQPVLDAALRMS